MLIHVALQGATGAGLLPASPEVRGWGLVALVGAVWLGGYLLACRNWPYRACRWCKGTGKRRSPSGKAHGKCRHGCQGGAKLRAGRRLVEWWRA